jgi:type IV secretion system protein VirB9
MRLLLVLLAFWPLPASGQVYPQPGDGDPRIQNVRYDPAQVIRLSVAPGLQTMVQLAAGDGIETIAVGDSSVWQVTAGKRGDFFFIKNIGAYEMTNMTVVTAGRVYNFELAPSNGYDDVSPYHIRVTYPERSSTTVTQDVTARYEYRLSGKKAIRPSRVYQEGSRTILEWPDDRPLPAIFTLENEHEALVNGEMQDGRFVIAGTPIKLIFRLDDKTAYATREAVKDAFDD